MSLLNQVQLEIARYQTSVGYLQHGIITSSDPARGVIKATLEPDETETGWIPYCTPWIGWFAPPQPGDQVIILFQEGDKNVPIGALSVYWNKSLPPSGVQVGEAIIRHSSGSYIKLNNDGSVHIQANSIVLDGEDESSDFLAKFPQLKAYIDGHTHTGVQPGGGNTGAPSSPLPQDVSTTIVKGE